MAVVVGLLVILAGDPRRLLAVVGWPVTPVSVLLVAIGFTLELLAGRAGSGRCSVTRSAAGGRGGRGGGIVAPSTP